MEKMIAYRKDYDCRENRLLDSITEFMNSKCGRNTFYGNGNVLVYVENEKDKYFQLRVTVYNKRKDDISINKTNTSLYINKDDGFHFLKIFRIKETIRTIQKQRDRIK